MAETNEETKQQPMGEPKEACERKAEVPSKSSQSLQKPLWAQVRSRHEPAVRSPEEPHHVIWAVVRSSWVEAHEQMEEVKDDSSKARRSRPAGC